MKPSWGTSTLVGAGPPNRPVDAIVATRGLLVRLTQPQETPRIPRELRREARALLRHYPIAQELRPLLAAALRGRGAEWAPEDELTG